MGWDLTELGANEYYSDFDNIAHNTPVDLLTLWIIPK